MSNLKDWCECVAEAGKPYITRSRPPDKRFRNDYLPFGVQRFFGAFAPTIGVGNWRDTVTHMNTNASQTNVHTISRGSDMESIMFQIYWDGSSDRFVRLVSFIFSGCLESNSRTLREKIQASQFRSTAFWMWCVHGGSIDARNIRVIWHKCDARMVAMSDDYCCVFRGILKRLHLSSRLGGVPSLSSGFISSCHLTSSSSSVCSDWATLMRFGFAFSCFCFETFVTPICLFGAVNCHKNGSRIDTGDSELSEIAMYADYGRKRRQMQDKTMTMMDINRLVMQRIRRWEPPQSVYQVAETARCAHIQR